MNSKTVLLLLGTACLFALVHLSAGEDAAGTAPEVAAGGRAPSKANHGKPVGGAGPGGKSHDFRKEVEKIFDEFKVDPKTRDNILDRIRQRMEELKVQGGFRRRGGKGKDGKGGKGDKDKKQ